MEKVYDELIIGSREVSDLINHVYRTVYEKGKVDVYGDMVMKQQRRTREM